MTSMHDPVLVSRSDAVVTITLNRPEVLNALDLAACEALRERLVEAERDQSVRAVILIGRGRAFCAGGDLRFAMTVNPDRPGDSLLALTAVLHPCIAEIRTMPKPVIAAINGPAAGAGFYLALATDLRLMADTGYLKQSNTSYGLSTPAGGSFLLPRMVGMARALEILMLDEPIPASRAAELGLVTRVVPAAALRDLAQELADRVSRGPVGTLGRVKRLMNQAFRATLDEQLEAERSVLAASGNSAEGREGIAAFLEKRRPDYRAAV